MTGKRLKIRHTCIAFLGVSCPTCNENLECTWNTTCRMSENCMVREMPGSNYTTHCIMVIDRISRTQLDEKEFVKTHSYIK